MPKPKRHYTSKVSKVFTGNRPDNFGDYAVDIPDAVRTKLGLKPGDSLVWRVESTDPVRISVRKK